MTDGDVRYVAAERYGLDHHNVTFYQRGRIMLILDRASVLMIDQWDFNTPLTQTPLSQISLTLVEK